MTTIDTPPTLQSLTGDSPIDLLGEDRSAVPATGDPSSVTRCQDGDMVSFLYGSVSVSVEFAGQPGIHPMQRWTVDAPQFSHAARWHAIDAAFAAIDNVNRYPQFPAKDIKGCRYGVAAFLRHRCGAVVEDGTVSVLVVDTDDLSVVERGQRSAMEALEWVLDPHGHALLDGARCMYEMREALFAARRERIDAGQDYPDAFMIAAALRDVLMIAPCVERIMQGQTYEEAEALALGVVARARYALPPRTVLEHTAMGLYAMLR